MGYIFTAEAFLSGEIVKCEMVPRIFMSSESWHVVISLSDGVSFPVRLEQAEIAVMAYCCICFDEGSDGDPLIQPCSNCKIELHHKCVLNLISTHLISQRLAVNNQLMLYRPNQEVLLEEDETMLLTAELPRIQTFFTPFDNKRTTYRKYINRGGICSLPPAFDVMKSNKTMLLHTFDDPQLVLCDQCPHCKGWIKMSSYTGELSVLKYVLRNTTSRNIFERYMHVFKRINRNFRAQITKQDMISLTRFLTPVVCSVSSFIPWIYLFRNLKEYQDALDIPVLLFPIVFGDLFVISCKMVSFKSPASFIQLVYMLLTTEKSLPIIFRISALAIRFASDLLYCVTINLVYLNMAIKFFPSDLKEIMGQCFGDKDVDVQGLSFRRKISLALNFDFKPLFRPEFSIVENEAIGFLSLYASSEAPFDCLLLILGGGWIGNKVISRCKPIVRSIYRLFNRYEPVPFDIELCLEYLGYQSVLFIRQIVDVIYQYNRYSTYDKYQIVPYEKENELDFALGSGDD